MSITDKHVSATELSRATQVVDAKIAALQEIVDKRAYDLYPGEGFRPDFAEWEDEAKGLEKFAKSILYTTNYATRRDKVKELLDSLRAGRQAQLRKSKVVEELEARAEAAEARADEYVDQWAQVSAELEDAHELIAQLQQDNADLRARLVKVQPIRKADSIAVPN